MNRMFLTAALMTLLAGSAVRASVDTEEEAKALEQRIAEAKARHRERATEAQPLPFIRPRYREKSSSLKQMLANKGRR